MRWGAIAKVKHIEDTYPELLGKVFQFRDMPSSTSSEPEQPSWSDGGRTLDLEAVLRASQKLSGQIIHSDLVKELMKLVIEVAGAEKGFLILKKGDSLILEASSTATGGGEYQFTTVPVEQSKELSVAIVNYSAGNYGSGALE